MDRKKGELEENMREWREKSHFASFINGFLKNGRGNSRLEEGLVGLWEEQSRPTSAPSRAQPGREGLCLVAGGPSNLSGR